MTVFLWDNLTASFAIQSSSEFHLKLIKMAILVSLLPLCKENKTSPIFMTNRQWKYRLLFLLMFAFCLAFKNNYFNIKYIERKIKIVRFFNETFQENKIGKGFFLFWNQRKIHFKVYSYIFNINHWVNSS